MNVAGLPNGEKVIFMKVGVHASESLEDILERKRKEIADVGFSMWGYGGNSAHPNRVRAFAAEPAGEVQLVMQEIDSHHFADQVRARQFSADGGINWLDVPEGINVLGSKYALCLRSIDDASFDLNLAATRVAVGLKQGQSGLDYIRGRVDKACLELLPDDDTADQPGSRVHISFTAPLTDPYAVLLRD
jgi:hypothetical protein